MVIILNRRPGFRGQSGSQVGMGTGYSKSKGPGSNLDADLVTKGFGERLK